MQTKQMKNKGKKGYRYCVPLKPSLQRLLDSIRECADVLGQQKAMHQALGDPPPFSLGPCPHTSGGWQRLVAELEGGLPPCLGPTR